MNFLGHAYFSPDNDEILTGNVFGDFVKGRIENIDLPANFKKGLTFHRKIDSLCNDSNGYHLIKKSIGKNFGHYNAVIADIFMDHFLAVYWNKFSDISLEIFAESTYEKMEKHKKYFPGDFTRVFLIMKKDNWLVKNKEADYIEDILKRIEKYHQTGVIIHTSVKDLKANHNKLKEYFFEFMNEMKEAIQKLN